MTWLSVTAIDQFLETYPHRDALGAVYALHRFVSTAFYCAGFKAPSGWSDAITPTKAGTRVLHSLQEEFSDYTPDDISLGLLRTLYHEDLLVDPAECNIERIRSLIEESLFSGQARWPYIHDRTLYDRFNDWPPREQSEHLEPDEYERLLSDTPQGVYQIGGMLIGPLGVLASAEQRFMPPVTLLPLWHCEDTGCKSLHQVTPLLRRVDAIKVAELMDAYLDQTAGRQSEWGTALKYIHRWELQTGPRAFYDLPSLLADGVVGSERTSLVDRALRSHSGGFLRGIIGAPPRKRQRSQGPSQIVALGLNAAEQLQLLLILSNAELINLLDQCIWDGTIRIATNETRAAQLQPSKLSSVDQSAELSVFGARSTNPDPLLALVALIWDAYQSRENLDELGWKLTKRVGRPSREDLMDYVRLRGPATAVNELILSSMSVALGVAKKLQLNLEGGEENGQVLNRILWKLGFDPSRHGEEYLRFRARLDHFNQILLRIVTVRTENDREDIRSSGVNLFVSVEHVVEQLIAYNVWLLSSDHFLESDFVYDPREAVRKVSEAIGRVVEAGGVQFTWQAEGGNTLGTLHVYLNKTVSWMASLPELDRGGIQRANADLPHFASRTDLIFPFWHTELWADADAEELRAYTAGFAGIAEQLSRSNFAAIRNGLDHKREDSAFPSSDAMLACAARLRESLELADVGRYLPKTFWLEQTTRDRFGLLEYNLKDYLERELILYGPSVVIGVQRLGFSEPFIVAPRNLLGQPGSELVFRLREPTPYAEFWRGYPRRRGIVARIGVEAEQPPPGETARSPVAGREGPDDVSA
jgi:hypothetical protein